MDKSWVQEAGEKSKRNSGKNYKKENNVEEKEEYRKFKSFNFKF